MKSNFINIGYNLNNKKVLVIGGGKIALRKVKRLLEYDCCIEMISIDYIKEFEELELIKKEKAIELEDIKNYDLVFACTNDKVLNKQIVEYCDKQKILVNNASSKEDMSFKMLASFKYEDVEVSVSVKDDRRKAKKIIDKILGIFISDGLY